MKTHCTHLRIFLFPPKEAIECLRLAWLKRGPQRFGDCTGEFGADFFWIRCPKCFLCWLLVHKSPGFQFSSAKTVPEAEAVPEAPATEAPATEAPATEAPAIEAPATEAPATEAPATEAPATEAPATDAGVTEEAPAEVVPQAPERVAADPQAPQGQEAAAESAPAPPAELAEPAVVAAPAEMAEAPVDTPEMEGAETAPEALRVERCRECAITSFLSSVESLSVEPTWKPDFSGCSRSWSTRFGCVDER